MVTYVYIVKMFRFYTELAELYDRRMSMSATYKHTSLHQLLSQNEVVDQFTIVLS